MEKPFNSNVNKDCGCGKSTPKNIDKKLLDEKQRKLVERIRMINQQKNTKVGSQFLI